MPARRESKTLQDQLNILFGKELFEETEKRLVFGSVFRIPDEVSGIPSGKRTKGKTSDHPFVVLKYFKETNRMVLCARRTTDLNRSGYFTPENILPDLDKPGVIVLDEQFRIDAQKFVNFEYLGLLPDACIEALKKAVMRKG